MAQLLLPVGSRDHIRGPSSAPLTLVEYGDFECPHCGQAHPVVLDLISELGPSLRFVYRHFPLRTLHPHAERAALTAEAAAVQGKFWEMHDLLFESQQALEDPDLLRYAEFLDFDLEGFEKDLRESRHFARVREDFTSGVRSGVNGTPTFFVNGVRHDGSYDFPVLLRALLESARV